MHLRLVALTAAAAIAGQAAEAQVRSRGPMQDAINNLLDPIRWVSADTLDLAGVKLGMTQEQARAALVAKGFQPRASDPGQPAWSTLVGERVAERRRGAVTRTEVPRFTMAEGPQGEHIEVWYAPTAAGARVANVSYSIPANRMERSAFLAGVAAKYGKASFEQGSTRAYCSRGADSRSSCWQFGDVLSRPGLLASGDFSLHTIRLSEGTEAADRRKQLLAAEVEAKAPKNAAASF